MPKKAVPHIFNNCQPDGFHEIIRKKSEQTRYKTYYDIDLMDTSIYDLIIYLSHETPDEILTIILKNIQKG